MVNSKEISVYRWRIDKFSDDLPIISSARIRGNFDPCHNRELSNIKRSIIACCAIRCCAIETDMLFRIFQQPTLANCKGCNDFPCRCCHLLSPRFLRRNATNQLNHQLSDSGPTLQNIMTQAFDQLQRVRVTHEGAFPYSARCKTYENPRSIILAVRTCHRDFRTS